MVDAASVAARLRALAAELDGATLSTDRIPEPWSDKRPTVDEVTRLVVEDYYVSGRVAAMKGARENDYRNAEVVFGALGAVPGIPRHYSVIVPRPDGTPADASDWVSALASVGDIGWIDGERYRYNPSIDALSNRRNWIAAGCPHFNTAGQYGNDGLPIAIDRAAWDEWERRFRNQ